MKKHHQSTAPTKVIFLLMLFLTALWTLPTSVFALTKKHHSKHTNARSSHRTTPQLGISTNPGATNVVTGTGALGRLLGIKKSTGVELGGLWITDGDVNVTGGVKGKNWSGNNLLIMNLNLDTQKMSLWKGGLFGVQFLQFNGMNSNVNAGSVQTVDGLPAQQPLHRSQLYQLWYRQALFSNKLVIRVGKSLTSLDFNNVQRPVPVTHSSLAIPSVSGLIYTPMFVNSSILGALPSYYNSAYGVSATFTPTKNFYIASGAYDGNLAHGRQTGLEGPHFNGYYFYISEAGLAWKAGNERKPGTFAIGSWQQTGKFNVNRVQQRGMQGFYTFGSQRLWFRHPGRDNSGMSGFFQYGTNNSKTLPVKKYLGLGLTFFALTRPRDSFGIGMAHGWLNKNLFVRATELILQGYYQAHLFSDIYLEGVMSYSPKPGLSEDIPETWTATLQIIALF